MKKTALVISLFCLLGFTLFGQSGTWSVKFSNAILSRYTPTINTMTNKGWEYSNSIVLSGIEQVYGNTRDTNYLNYIKKYVDAYVSPSGAITGLAASLDKIHPGLLCLYLYKETGQVKYKTAATNLRNYLLGTGGNPSVFAKTPDGGFWHKSTGYDNTMMLDGIYMAHPFLAKYAAMFKDDSALNTATRQTLLLASHVYDSSLHLAKHAWNCDKSTAWADHVTGASSEVWSRAMGWYVMAIVDILKYLPSSHPDYSKMRNLLDSLVIGIKNTQDDVSGLWYQVMDKKDSAANYLETSGSGMFIYAIKTAVDNEWIDTSYLSVARKGWAGLQTEIATYTDGKPQIKSFAPAMSVQNDYTDYVSYLPVNCPAPGTFTTQHPHGYCGLLLAASAMEFPVKTYTFIGDGSWDDIINWQNNEKPPTTLPNSQSIVIDPVVNGSCTLINEQHISAGARLTVKAGKKFIISAKLVIQ